ncbi:VTT domain-containing protein [Maricaulis sp.]|uniref:TVP38/TMEM64 family protein n=1 Tax=Maricaulis sp. TaxID=1486257 RepID=UPI0026178FA8|nr:VTT domain-containing protein [Maricaulis sp.]MDF1769977.1 VTT domain-containing protein [Maricaulis sp.]
MRNAADQPPQMPPGPGSTGLRWLRRFVLIALLLVIAGLLLTGRSPLDLLAWLRESRGLTQDVIHDHFALAVILCALGYVLLASLALPGALWLTIAAGFVLGQVWAIPVSLLGLTLGAINTVLLVRFLAGDARRTRLRERYRRLAAGFERDQLTYMILLRLLPLPYFGVNLAAGLSRVSLGAIALGTLIGSLPSVILYAGFGAGLGSLSEMEALPGPAALLQPQVLLPLLMIIPLAMAPLLWRRWQRRRKARALPGKTH